MPRIFISYSSKDEPFARRLAADLDQLGGDVAWIDVDDIPAGTKWIDAIQDGLDACEVMILVITPDSMQSANVADEWQYYLDHHKPVIPVLWKSARIHFRLNPIQYVNFHTQDYDTAFAQLYAELRRKHLPLTSLSAHDASVKIPAQPRLKAQDSRSRRVYWAIGAVVAVALIGIAALLLNGGDDHRGNETATPTPTPIPEGISNREVWPQPLIQTFDGVEMVYVPAGCFMMGSREGSGDEQPVHEVCLDAFWLARTEVTNEQYKACVRARACTPPGDRTAYDNPQYANHPVVYVDWDQASAYATWAGGSLPTEAQWEYAARGSEGLDYPWGNEFDGARLNFCDQNCEYSGKDTFYDDGYSQTAPVGSYPSGTSWVGALDMAGNVSEWTRDWMGDYPSAQQQDPTGPTTGTSRVVRGSSWGGLQLPARVWPRSSSDPGAQFNSLGFRCARSAE